MLITISNLLEEQVYFSIKASLNGDETIEYKKDFDLYLPNGLRKMGWPPNTYIDIKYKLIFNTFDRIVEQCRRLNNKPLKLIIVVSDEKEIRLKKPPYKVDGCDIEVWLYKDIKRKLANRESTIELNESVPYEEEIKNRLNKDRVSLFLGAGVSKSANVPDWSTLLEKLSENTDWIKREHDNVIKGRHIVNKHQDDLLEKIKTILYADNPVPSPLIKAIAKIVKKRKNVESVISYNYDNLLEKCLEWNNAALYANQRMLNCEYKPIYHVHGFIPQEGDGTSIILGEKDYHQMYQDVYNWSNIEQLHALSRNTCLFIGLSMKDPNLRRLMDISNQQSTGDVPFYVFLCEEDKNINFELFKEDMNSFGIKCVKCKKYDDLPKLLNRLVE